MTRVYNKRVHPRHSEVGQLVLKCILLDKKISKRKFAPNGKGPYIIWEVLSEETLHFTIVDEKIAGIIIYTNIVKR